jgi:hypothetical protein
MRRVEDDSNLGNRTILNVIQNWTKPLGK